MNRYASYFVALGAVLLVGITSLTASADDSAASIAVGGLVARRETRIVMAKEVLRISEKKVVVDYDFRNDSDEDVTTEVAFPVPPYANDWDDRLPDEQSFSGFQLHLDGKPARFSTDAKATLKGKDVTAILAADKIDVASFGHFEMFRDGGRRIHDLDRLQASEQKRLVKLGLFGDDPPEAYWTVHLQFHWTQTFPAHAVVHIRHEYQPVLGFTQVSLSEVENSLKRFTSDHSQGLGTDGDKFLAGFCADGPFLSRLTRELKQSEVAAKTDEDRLFAGTVYPNWVDFILTTANTWQRPIEDFSLIVERPHSRMNGVQGQTLISFCSPENGKVDKLDTDQFQVHLTYFVPTAELHIGFFGVPEAKGSSKHTSRK